MAENIYMITRFVSIGLLCVVLFFSCKTNEELKYPKDRLTVQEEVDILIEDYISYPEVLIEKLLLVLENRDHDYNPLIARLYLSLGEYKNAEDFITIDVVNESDPENLKILAICKMGLGEEYNSLLKEILTLDENNLFALTTLAGDHIKTGELNSAESYINIAYQTDPNDKRTLILCGDLALSRVEKLNLSKKKVLSLNEESVVTSYYKRALDYYLKAGDSSDAGYYVKLAGLYKKLGKKMESVYALDRAIELDADDPWNYYDRGKLYFYLGENQLALPDLEMAYSLDPDNFFTNVFLGRVSYALDEVERAQFYYGRVLKMNPDYYPAYRDMSVLSYITGDKETSLNFQIKLYNNKKDRDPFIPILLVNSLFDVNRDIDAKKILENLVKYEKNVTMKGLYKYFLDPDRTGDQVLNNALTVEDEYQRMRLSYYVSCALERGGIHSLSASLLEDVASSNIRFESKLAKYKLGEIYE